MGRAHEVRAASMAKTAAKKSAMNGRAAKEIYMAAKQGGTDPNSNLTLRAVIDKAKANQIPKDVIDRAIKRASGSDSEQYVSNRYEGIGPGNSAIIVDSLTSNVNRASATIKEVFNKNGGNSNGKVAFMFEEVSIFAFKHQELDEILDYLLNNDIEVNDISKEDDEIIVYAPFKSFSTIKKALDEFGITDYTIAEVSLIPTEEHITINNEIEYQTFLTLLEKLDELDDVQNVYHNVKITK